MGLDVAVFGFQLQTKSVEVWKGSAHPSHFAIIDKEIKQTLVFLIIHTSKIESTFPETVGGALVWVSARGLLWRLKAVLSLLLLKGEGLLTKHILTFSFSLINWSQFLSHVLGSVLQLLHFAQAFVGRISCSPAQCPLLPNPWHL